MSIKDYWDERAATTPKAATTDDVYLRVLERSTLIQQLTRLGCNNNSRILDAGCGDGATLLALQNAFHGQLTGRDYSASMIELAKQRFDSIPDANIDLAVGDVRKLSEMFAPASFDFVSTCRCLINLETETEQYDAIGGIASQLKPGGYYLAIENFVEGNESLNKARALYELPAINIRWHNRFFNTRDFKTQAAKHFQHIEMIEFSSAYYFATRVIYSKLCAIEGKSPDYQHDIHRMSVDLPVMGDFSPVKLFILRK